jgi:hypothetical protein
MSLVLQSSGGGSVTIQEPTTASNLTATLPAATGTIVISGTTPSLNGITFPATAVPSADANTLDDYEEGTWTPAVSVNNGTATTYTIGTAYYTKVGRLVTVNGNITPTNGTLGSTNGYIRFTGLPFTALGFVSTGSGLNSSNLNNGIATIIAYSNTIDAAFVTACASNNQWTFSVTYIV